MANTELENNIDLALQKARISNNYADTILGNTHLDENDGVNINLDVASSAKFKVEGSTFVIDSTQLELPYVELEYIESTGTQYIDTKYISNSQKTIIEAYYKCTQLVASANGLFYAGSSASTNSFDYSMSYGGANFDKMRITMGSNYNYYVDVNASTNYRTLKIDCISSKVTLDSTQYSITKTDWTATQSLKLFKNNGCAQIAYFRIYDNDTLVHNFIPVIRKSDYEYCMYDTVTNEFFINQGTGKFKAGPVV